MRSSRPSPPAAGATGNRAATGPRRSGFDAPKVPRNLGRASFAAFVHPLPRPKRCFWCSCSHRRPRRIKAMTVEAHPVVHDIPIGIAATGRRREIDSMGGIEVPADRYWGAQTQRSLVHFAIGEDRMPKRLYRAYSYVKKAAAVINAASGRLAPWKAEA